MEGIVKTKDTEPWFMGVMAIVASVWILIWLCSLVAIYVVDEYASPAWDERSVPAPSTY